MFERLTVALENKIVGKSTAAIQLKKMIEIVAPSEAPVVVNGPTGSGKELVAEALHEISRRKGEFVTINCAAIPKELIEAELFGFEKGAFTGAIKSTPGKFEQANRGTLFLDEIGDMPSDLQTKLLRVLESSKVSRVGGNKQIKLDLRIVCATHKDLNQLVERGEFREDLLFRLNVFPIKVPNLRDRIEDLPLILEHLVSKRVSGNPTIGKPIFSKSGLIELKKYSWPGNIRELRNIVERAIIFFPKKEITDSDVRDYLIQIKNDVVLRVDEQDAMWESLDNLLQIENKDEIDNFEERLPAPKDFAKWFQKNNSVDLRGLLRDIEIVLIEAAIERNGGNSSEAARDLKLIRTTLIEKMKKYGI